MPSGFVACLSAIALIAAGASAAAQQAGPSKRVPMPAPRPAQAQPAEPDHAGEAPIICTKYGCNPLPPKCHAELEETYDGPTGYQVIVCP